MQLVGVGLPFEQVMSNGVRPGRPAQKEMVVSAGQEKPGGGPIGGKPPTGGNVLLKSPGDAN
jgi:hypothetical protein